MADTFLLGSSSSTAVFPRQILRSRFYGLESPKGALYTPKSVAARAENFLVEHTADSEVVLVVAEHRLMLEAPARDSKDLADTLLVNAVKSELKSSLIAAADG